jgi:hypothetical protein
MRYKIMEICRENGFEVSSTNSDAIFFQKKVNSNVYEICVILSNETINTMMYELININPQTGSARRRFIFKNIDLSIELYEYMIKWYSKTLF